MFSLYGLTGPVFTGTLEQLGEIRAMSRIRPVRAIAADEVKGLGAEALHSYQAAIHADLERGPLYHAYQIMSRKVISVTADETVAQAWSTLQENRIHQAPVLDDRHQLIGMAGEHNLLTAFAAEREQLQRVLGKKVRDIISSPVVTVAPVTDIRRVVRVMLDYGVDGVPVVDDAHVLVGFISRTDILNAVVTDPPLSLWR